MKHYDHVVVGMGMSALGVLEGLSNDDTLSILVIDISNSEDEIYYKNDSSFKFGKIGDGGNSDLWHGVISKITNLELVNYDESFDLLFNLYYPGVPKTNFDSFSFIPFRPLRPKKIIKDKFNGKIEILYDCLRYFEYNENYVELYFVNKTVSTSKLWLCTGSQGTLKVLNQSKVLKEAEYYLDEHLVGYFGQSKTGTISSDNKVIFTRKGHSKRFVTVKQEGVRSMYLNIRPAHFGFKNLQYASKFRSFFGQSTKIIILRLLSLLNPALMIEALYNKFGVAFSSSINNIVGHVEIERSIRFDVKSNNFSLNTDSITLTAEELDILKSKFGNTFTSNDSIPLSPGLHLINLDKPIGINYIDEDLTSPTQVNSSIFICSGVALKLKSPVHPTFSLLVLSYLKAKNIIKNNFK